MSYFEDNIEPRLMVSVKESNKKFKCGKCNRKFKDENGVTNHEDSKHKEN